MNNPRPLLILLLCSQLLLSCDSGQTSLQNDNEPGKSLVKHASGLAIVRHSSWIEVVVKQPWKGATVPIKYALTTAESALGDIPEGYQIIEIPVTKVASTSTTHLPHFEAIGEVRSLKGFANGGYVYSQVIKERLDAGDIVEIGNGNGVNLESCLSLKPQAMFTFSMGNDLSNDQRLTQAGIDLLYNADYLETTPLGRAEWLKFTAAFFNKLDIADSVFSAIEQNYLGLKAKAQATQTRPVVLTGVVYGDTWFLPGGKNYGAAFFEDAGGQYLWSENDQNGWLELSFESVYEKASLADFWIGVASFASLNEMTRQESRYKLFSPWKGGEVYNYDNQVAETGGSNYLEEGYSRPDLILADLIRIIHPEVLPDHSLYFYRKLP